MKKGVLNKIIIFLVFFLQTMSFVNTLNLNNIKYISICILNGLIIMLYLIKGIKRKEITSFLVILLILIVSCYFQPTSISGKVSSIVFYVTLLLWSLLSSVFINKRKDILYMVYGIASGVILGLILSFDMVLVQLSGLYNTRERIWGGFTHPNHLGGIISCAIIGLYAYKFIGGIKKKNKLYYYLLMIVLAFLLYCTKSRTSWIVTVVAIVAMNVKLIQGQSKSIRILLYIMLISSVVYIGYFFINEYALQDGAFKGRLDIFNVMEVTPKTFIVGNGMVNSSNLNRGNTNGGAMEIAWVMLFYKNGIIGVLSFIAIILILLIRSRTVKNKDQLWAFRGILIAFMVGTIGEAYMVNITNLPALFNWVVLCALSSNIFDVKTLQ